MTKSLLVTVVALAAFIVNPGFGCSPQERDRTFDYGAREMRAAIEGTWKLRVPGKPETTLTIVQGAGAEQQHAARASLVRSASACSEQSFVRSASACVDESAMPLDVKVVGSPKNKPSSGMMRVMGLEFRVAEVKLHFDELSIDATITRSGKVEAAEVSMDKTPVSLVRVR